MSHRKSALQRLGWTNRNDIWTLRAGTRTLAVIEPSWSDQHSNLFLANASGDLDHAGTYGRSIARLRILLRLWFLQTGSMTEPVRASRLASRK